MESATEVDNKKEKEQEMTGMFRTFVAWRTSAERLSSEVEGDRVE